LGCPAQIHVSVAGGADDDIGCAGRAAGEADSGALEPVDARPHDDPSGFQRPDEAVIDGHCGPLRGYPGEGAEVRARVAVPAQVPTNALYPGNRGAARLDPAALRSRP